tara:strand:- start:2265 stop:3644 length:1380 start_codon:yes stop_codon:yes gene_type:complete
MNSVDITIIGSGGNIGRYLSLLFKTDTENITKINLYDISPINKGVAKDLSFINTPVDIVYYPKEQLYEAMQSDIIIVVAGFPRKDGMTRGDLLSKNAEIIYDIVLSYSKIIRNIGSYDIPYLCIATNPVNSIMPIVRLICMEFNIWERVSDKVIGLTYLDTIRLRQITNKLDDENVYVVGGHSKNTMVIYPKDTPLDIKLQLKSAGESVIKAYNNKGSASLSMAYATYSFIIKLIQQTACIGMVWVNHRFISTHLTFGKNIGKNIGKEVSLSEETNNILIKEALLSANWWEEKKKSITNIITDDITKTGDSNIKLRILKNIRLQLIKTRFYKPDMFPNGAEGWNLQKAPIDISIEISYTELRKLFNKCDLELNYSITSIEYTRKIRHIDLMKALDIDACYTFDTNILDKSLVGEKRGTAVKKTSFGAMFNYPIYIFWNNKNNLLKIQGNLCFPVDITKI